MRYDAGLGGAEIGGQEFSQIIVFQTPAALQSFKNGTTDFGAEATAIAVEEGAASKSMFKDNVAVFTYAEKGLQVQASLAGQKFNYQPIAAPSQPPSRLDRR